MSKGIVQGTEVLRSELENAEFRAEWERTALARALALRVVEYRAESGLSQAALGRLLGMAQSGVARLEAGEHTPTLDTLSRIAQVLGIHLRVDLDPAGSVHLVERAS
jgi:ribosome-binding protein aMBF1 (putative translation factor)